MKLSPPWLREFVDLRVDYHQLADDLTLAGIAVESVSGEGEATLFEMEITTNRPDAMNHYGVARECSALYDVALRPLDAELPSAQGKADFAIEIANPEDCARYTARIIRGVTIKPSPENITNCLTSVDQRPINNIADASNYTLWEMGHPTHAFDLDLLEGGKLIVRRARSGEKLKTLDGAERSLSSEDLIIADAVKPVALAGVMGGFDTMITGKTKNVLVESAWFDPVMVRKSSRRHGLHTDASHRFERGADFGATPLACARVTRRILESAGGTLQGEAIDVVARRLEQAPVVLRLAEVRRILGETLGANEVLRILRHLGFDLMPEPGDQQDFTVQIPTWRLDVEREIDVIEEIARLHGYDKFSSTLPPFAGSVIEQPDASKDARLRTTLLAMGYNEAISLTFISHNDAEQFSSTPVLELENPLSEEASVLRTSMVPGMLNMLAYNLNRGSESARLFERGNVFGRAGNNAVEAKNICLGATGAAVEAGPHQQQRKYSFFDLKGEIEALLHGFEHKSLYFDAHTSEHYYPGRSARAVLDGATVAQFGQIDPETAATRKLRQDVFIGEIYLDRLYQHPLRQPRYQPLPKHPAVQRDFSFVFEDSVVFEKIAKAVSGLALTELREFAPVEIFRGGSIPAGKYSVLLRATLQSSEHTLREDELSVWSAAIVKALQSLGGTLRSR